jgi:hypothetical protein
VEQEQRQPARGRSLVAEAMQAELDAVDGEVIGSMAHGACV